jgi:hypothetical protein
MLTDGREIGRVGVAVAGDTSLYAGIKMVLAQTGAPSRRILCGVYPQVVHIFQAAVTPAAGNRVGTIERRSRAAQIDHPDSRDVGTTVAPVTGDASSYDRVQMALMQLITPTDAIFGGYVIGPRIKAPMTICAIPGFIHVCGIKLERIGIWRPQENEQRQHESARQKFKDRTSSHTMNSPQKF